MRITPSEQIDQLIANLADWRGETLAAVRTVFLGAAPEIVEEWKWMGSPTWSRGGIIAVGNAHKDKVKLTFAHGAALPDPDKLFNAGLGGGVWRAIDLHKGDQVNERALRSLICSAVEFNRNKSEKNASAGGRRSRAK